MPAPMQAPPAGEYAPFYQRYIDPLPQGNILDLLRRQEDMLTRLAAAVPPGRETFAYAPGKWTVRQVAGHMGDGERVFGYRALCFSRGDTAPLPAFDENFYVEHSQAAARPLADLAEEVIALRRANERLFAALDDAAWKRIGTANNVPVSVRALAYIIVGHVQHHLGILRERYGIEGSWTL
jgi:hypothetical protein